MSESTPSSRDSDGVLLMRTWDDGEAEIVRQILEERGIPCQVVSDVPHAVWPITVDGLGEIRLLVPRARLAQAREAIAEHLEEGARGTADGEDAGRSGDGPGGERP